MKQFLVLVAILPVTLLIMSEFTLNAAISAREDMINDIVYTYKEYAKQDGYFKNVEEEMKNALANAAGVSPDEIIFETNALNERKERVTSLSSASGILTSSGSGFDLSNGGFDPNLFIHYVVKVPVAEMRFLDNLVKNHSSEKKYYYVIDSYTASEYLPLPQ